jgi:hypothetical protein
LREVKHLEVSLKWIKKGFGGSKLETVSAKKEKIKKYNSEEEEIKVSKEMNVLV